MELKYEASRPIVKSTKTEKKRIEQTRDSLLVLAHVEPEAKVVIEYLTGLASRIDDDGKISPIVED